MLLVVLVDEEGLGVVTVYAKEGVGTGLGLGTYPVIGAELSLGFPQRI
jgi:hypothetical protein